MDKHTCTHVVQYYETDQMKIVHHSNYIRWFEEARCDWLKACGLSCAMLEEMGIYIPVLSVSAKYKVAVRFGQTVEIALKLKEFNGIKALFFYEVCDSESGLMCTVGESAHAFLDRNMKPLYLKRAYPEVYEKFALKVDS